MREPKLKKCRFCGSELRGLNFDNVCRKCRDKCNVCAVHSTGHKCGYANENGSCIRPKNKTCFYDIEWE